MLRSSVTLLFSFHTNATLTTLLRLAGLPLIHNSVDDRRVGDVVRKTEKGWLCVLYYYCTAISDGAVVVENLFKL